MTLVPATGQGFSKRRSGARLVSWLLAGVAGAAAAAAAAVLLEAVALRFVPGDSDGATVALEGSAISAGNLMLHGWSLSLDSFWSLDAAVNAAVVRISGLRPVDLTLTPSIIAAIVVVAGGLLAVERRSGLYRFVGPAVVVMLLALPSPDLAFFLLQGPWHIATALACLVAFSAISSGRCVWGLAAAAVVLGIALVGDLLALLFGVLPMIAAGIAAALRCRSARRAQAPVLAGLVSVLVALGIRELAVLAGTFRIVNRNVPVRLSQLESNVALLANRLSSLFGVGSMPASPGNGPVAFEAFRVVGLLAVAASLLAGLFNLVVGVARGRPGSVSAASRGAQRWLLDDLLVLGVLADVAVFVVGASNNNPQYARYLMPGVIFAVVLTGRMAGRLVSWLRMRSRGQHVLDLPARATAGDGPLVRSPLVGGPAGDGPLVRSPLVGGPVGDGPVGDGPVGDGPFIGRPAGGGSPRRRGAGSVGIGLAGAGLAMIGLVVISLAGLATIAAFGAQVVTELRRPLAVQPADGLGAFLEKMGLRRGIGDYWSSSVVTVETSRSVVVRPVTTNTSGTLRRYGRQSPTSWYAGKRFEFFVYDTARPWRHVDAVSAEATYGPPSALYQVGPYQVLVWGHPVSVSLQVPVVKSPLEILW